MNRRIWSFVNRRNEMARLREVADFTADFLRALQPLDEEKKLGPVLFQLPPFLKCDVALLKDFLSALPRSLRAAFDALPEAALDTKDRAQLDALRASKQPADSDRRL